MFNGMPKIPGMSATDQILQGSKGDREWLFCIPIQVGPTTPYARNVSHWMTAILVVQTIICVLRFIILYDSAWAGAFWMALVCGLGWYALKNDLNITYVCTWGLLCIVNAVFDVLGLVLPFIIGVLKIEIGKTILRICIPVSYIVGALFAWHLYHDYADTHGKAGQLPSLDPMGSVMNVTAKMGGQSGKTGMATMGGGGYGAAAVGGAALAAGATAGGAAAAANSSSWLKGVFSGASGKPAASQAPTAEDMRAGAQQGMDNLASGAHQAYSWGQDSYARNAPYAQESLQQGQAQAQSAFFGMQSQAQAAMASGQQQARGMFTDDQQQQAQAALGRGQEQARGFFSSFQSQGQDLAARGQQQAEGMAGQTQAAQDAMRNASAQGQQQASGFFARMQGQNQNPFATHDRQA